MLQSLTTSVSHQFRNPAMCLDTRAIKFRSVYRLIAEGREHKECRSFDEIRQTFSLVTVFRPLSVLTQSKMILEYTQEKLFFASFIYLLAV